MDAQQLTALLHPAIVPKSLAVHPPLLLATQLAGASFCASLSHATVAANTTSSTAESTLATPSSHRRATSTQWDETVAELATRALLGPLQRALAAHYGAHALARGRQKPLDPCYRSRQNQQDGTHNGRNRALWRQSRRGRARRTWCARCGFPQKCGASRVFHLPWTMKDGASHSRHRVDVSRSAHATIRACPHCVERQARRAVTLSTVDSASWEAAIHASLRSVTTTGPRSCHRRHRRAPRKRRAGTVTAHAENVTTHVGKRVAASVASLAALQPSSGALASSKRSSRVDATSRGAAAAAGGQRARTGAAPTSQVAGAALTLRACSTSAVGASTGKESSAKKDSGATSRVGSDVTKAKPNRTAKATVSSASVHMAQLARSVPTGPVPRARDARPRPVSSTRTTTPASTPAAACQPGAPSPKPTAKTAPKSAPKAAGSTKKVLDVMKSLGI